MKIYFQRHSKTNWNQENRLQGSSDIPLNECGIEQSKQVAKEYKDIKFDKVICSNLIRAKQTAEIINEYHKLNIEIDERLTERNYGDFEGQLFNREQLYKNWDINLDYNENGVESMSVFFERTSKVFENLKNEKCENLLIITHSGVIIAAKYYFLGMPKDNNFMNYIGENFIWEEKLKKC